MITKEELLVALEDSSRALDKSTQIYGLALKGLESESTTKRLIQSRDQWRKKHDDLADELDDKIIALEIQTDHLRNGRLQAENQIGVLEDKLRDTVSLKYHYEIVDSANRQIISLRNKRDASQRSVSEMHAENNCMRADLENMCKELSVLKIENKKWEDAHRAKNADIDKLFTENKELARRERELGIVLGEWAAVEVYLCKSPKLTIGDKLSVACLRLLQERDKLEADLRFLLRQ